MENRIIDQDGNINTTPLTGWEMRTLPIIEALLISVQYPLTEDQLERGEHETLNLVLTRRQGEELIDSLSKAIQTLTPVDLSTLD